MSNHLFGSVTMPTGLEQLVGVHRLHADRISGTTSLLDGWRAFLAHTIAVGPLSLIDTAAEHLDHFGDQTAQAVHDLVGSAWPEAVALGLACRSLQQLDPGAINVAPLALPGWIIDLDSRRIVRASARLEAADGGRTPWVIELDFGRAEASSINIWTNPDGSLYQIYPTDDPIDELEAFLGEINHVQPSPPFERVDLSVATDALRAAAEHDATQPTDRLVLQWLIVSTPSPK